MNLNTKSVHHKTLGRVTEHKAKSNVDVDVDVDTDTDNMLINKPLRKITLFYL